jgi:hypothetical protein
VVPAVAPLVSTIGVEEANAPLNVPTDTVVPGTMHFGKFAGSDSSVPVGLLDKTSVPAPVASVVMVPTTVFPIVTLSVVLAAAPVTLTEKVVVATPLAVLTWKLTVPAAFVFDGSASVAVSEALGACPVPVGGWAVPAGGCPVPPGAGPHAPGGGGGGGVGFVATANVPLSAPTEISVPAATVGKPVGNACWPPVGLLESTSVPAPLAFVIRVPTTVVPIVTVSDVLAAAPVTLMQSVVLVALPTVQVVKLTDPAAVELLGPVNLAVSVVAAEGAGPEGGWPDGGPLKDDEPEDEGPEDDDEPADGPAGHEICAGGGELLL